MISSPLLQMEVVDALETLEEQVSAYSNKFAKLIIFKLGDGVLKQISNESLGGSSAGSI